VTTPPVRLHRGARAEDVVLALLARFLRRRGWTPRLLPFTGYGSAVPAVPGGQGWVRVLARVVLGPPPRSVMAREAARWWRQFLSVAAPGVAVRVRIGDETHELRSDRGGYVDAVLPAHLPAGWHELSIAVPGRLETTTPVRVVGADERLGIISDIDDTVMITALPRPLLAFWNTFVVEESKRRPVPGMAALYHRLRESEPDALVVYLSTGAWNVARPIARFLVRHGYPRGPLLMTDWGPTAQGWFRSGQAHKRRELRRLLRELPQLRWVLVGDDGQHDPQLYEELADEAPDAVRMVLIRELTTTQQVLTHGTPTPPESQAIEAPSPVPWLRGPDGEALAAQLPDRA
jgi:phosphatidate phosphatase APP1